MFLFSVLRFLEITSINETTEQIVRTRGRGKRCFAQIQYFETDLPRAVPNICEDVNTLESKEETFFPRDLATVLKSILIGISRRVRPKEMVVK